MYLGVGALVWVWGLPFRQIQFLHLNQSRIPIYQRLAPWVIQGNHGEVSRNRNPLHPYFGTAEMTSIEFLQILNFFE